MKFYIASGMKNVEAVNAYASVFQENGWEHTYNWTLHVQGQSTMEELIDYAQREQQGVRDADVVVVLLPAGRGTHIEMGMALALHKKIFLCAETESEFRMDRTVNFYQLPTVIRLIGTPEENIRKIMSDSESGAD